MEERYVQKTERGHIQFDVSAPPAFVDRVRHALIETGCIDVECPPQVPGRHPPQLAVYETGGSDE